MSNSKPSHNSIVYKKEYPVLYIPVPFRTAITAPLFWYEKWWNGLKSLIPKKKEKTKPGFFQRLMKPEPEKKEASNGN